jgi:hypothetical protein
MLKTMAFVATALSLSLAPMAMAKGKPDNPGDNSNENSIKTVTIEVTTTTVYMGNSMKTPPSAGALASQGTRTVQTTSFVDVTGFAGQVNPYADDQTKGCQGCTFGEPYGETSEVIDAPGKN